jgi:hypothetical protein
VNPFRESLEIAVQALQDRYRDDWLCRAYRVGAPIWVAGVFVSGALLSHLTGYFALALLPAALVAGLLLLLPYLLWRRKPFVPRWAHPSVEIPAEHRAAIEAAMAPTLRRAVGPVKTGEDVWRLVWAISALTATRA